MGNTASSDKTSNSNNGECPIVNGNIENTSSSECPMKKGSINIQKNECPMKETTTSIEKEECPMKNKKGVAYNVYGQTIDPSNQMPSNPNQIPNDTQRYPLETSRVPSTIPKGGVSGTWTYPSEQMFFNALTRKGKGEDVHEGDITTIVAIHNNMNEKTWKQVQEWEETLYPGSSSRLLKFMGRPDDMTPLAMLKYAWKGKPFDRHDWTIARDDGSEVRYVIDYYFDEGKSGEDKVPALHSASSVQSISIDARPAVDNIQSFLDRIRYPFLSSPEATKHAVEPTTVTDNKERSVEAITSIFETMKKSCETSFKAVSTCTDENDCAKAAMQLQHCMAKVVCPNEAEAFGKALKEGASEEGIATAFDAMNACIERFETESHTAMRQQASLEAAQQ